MHQKDIKDHGEAATATIMDKNERIERSTHHESRHGHSHRTEKRETKYFYVLEFADKEGKKHMVRHDTSRANWDMHEKGQTVDIKFLESNPEDVRLDKEVEGDPMLAFYVCGGIGGLMVLGGLGYFGWSFATGRIA